jgi:preprotein translocase subunit YajC
MDASAAQLTSTLFWIIPIIAYGVFEYQRREQNHKLILLALKYGKEPPTFEAKPQIWKLFTTGFVALILLALVVGFVVWRKQILYGGEAMYVLALVFLSMFAALTYALVKDIQAYRKQRKSIGE